MTTVPKGTLFLVPTPLDFGCDVIAPITDVLPQGTLRVASSVHHWITENAKSTRAFLKRVHDVTPLTQALQDMTITELPRTVHKKGDHLGEFDARPLLASALEGHNMALVSEAGMPAVADPGSSVVLAAHHLGIQVVPLVGPVSLLLALAASGLNGQNFAFVGYLPQDSATRLLRIKELEALVHKTGQTQLFIETPYRNQALWEALLKGLQPATRLSRASGLTMPTMDVQCRAVKDWRQTHAGGATALPAMGNAISNAPTVFAIGK
jgi:16S rRNA (cytidine1402-2'-O)-methyltransferase